MEIEMPDIITPQTMKRLKQHAEPLVDTVDSVINKLLDAYEAVKPNPNRKDIPASTMAIDGAIPPDLAFTTVQKAEISGVRLPKSGANWNGLMIAAIRTASKKLALEELDSMLIVNHALGEKVDSGYKYLADVGISIQGQDANNAWKGTFHLLKELKIPCTVEFVWQNNPKAFSPGAKGTFKILAAEL